MLSHAERVGVRALAGLAVVLFEEVRHYRVFISSCPLAVRRYFWVGLLEGLLEGLLGVLLEGLLGASTWCLLGSVGADVFLILLYISV